MTDNLAAQVVPYSSVVGSSVMLLDRGGPCVGMVSIRGMQEPLPQKTQEALAELIAAAVNQLRAQSKEPK